MKWRQPLNSFAFVNETEVKDVESYDFLTELNPDEIPNVDDVPPNSSLPHTSIWRLSNILKNDLFWKWLLFLLNLKLKRSTYLPKNPMSVSHHVSVCREEPVNAVVKELSKPSEATNALENRVSLDAGHCDSLGSNQANEAKMGGDAIPDSRGVWSAVCVLMVAAVIVGMENLKDEASRELNEETNGLGQRTSKDLTTDARVILEGVRSIAFNAEDDPGGLPIEDTPYTSIEDDERDIYKRDRGSVSVEENFRVIEEKDLPDTDSIVNESRGSEESRTRPR
jgi:hypothetical protein